MKLTVLGNNGPYPGREGACSGYLLEHNDKKILLDCGNGVLGKLQEHIELEELTHIILSHLHYDHMSDIMVLMYSIESKKKRGRNVRNIDLYLPDKPEDVYDKVVSKNIFNTRVINEELKVNLDDLEITFAEMNHPVKCFAAKYYSGGKHFVYSGDTGVCPKLVQFAKEADLLLCDAGLLTIDKTVQNAPHLTAYEVGQVAKDAGVKRLLLTHFWPEDDTVQHLKEAKENYPAAEIAVAQKSFQI